MHQQVLERGSAFTPTDRQRLITNWEHILYLKIQSPRLWGTSDCSLACRPPVFILIPFHNWLYKWLFFIYFFQVYAYNYDSTCISPVPLTTYDPRNCLILRLYPNRLENLQLSRFGFRRHVFRISALLPLVTMVVPCGFDIFFVIRLPR